MDARERYLWDLNGHLIVRKNSRNGALGNTQPTIDTFFRADKENLFHLFVVRRLRRIINPQIA